jgi:hypothetical protein
MSFDPSARYSKDELVRLARLFGVPLSTKDGKTKPKDRLMRNLTVESKTKRPSGKLATTFNPNGPMSYSFENLRMFAKERGILATVDGRRKTKQELLTHLIMAAKGMKLPSGAARKEPKAKTQKAPRKSISRTASASIPKLPNITASVAGPSRGAVVQMPNGNIMFAESRADKRRAAKAAARQAAMSRLP